MFLDRRSNTRAIDITPGTEASLQAANKHQEEAHQCCSDEKHWTSTPLVDVDDGGNCNVANQLAKNLNIVACAYL